MRLVGASNRFIQTPFVLEGVLAALIGSALASTAVWAIVNFGVGDYLRSRITFVTTWVGPGAIAVVVPVIVLIGVMLAALSAGFAIRRWLRTSSAPAPARASPTLSTEPQRVPGIRSEE